MSGKHFWPRPKRLWLLAGVVILLVAGVIGVAQAAEFGSGENYVLPAGSTVADDLYVSASTVTINGKVLGDLVAFGGSIEVNGEVTGDLMAAGGSVVVNGKVDDSVRVAGGAITVNGHVGHDLMAAGGGAAPGGFVFPVTTADGRSVQPGIFLSKGATVAGDAYLVGGSGEIAGAVAGNLFTGMNQVSLTGTVGGDAEMHGNTIVVADNAHVGGTLTYETAAGTAGAVAGATAVPPGVAAQVKPIVRTPPEVREEPLVNRLLAWMNGLVRVLVGLLVLGAVLLTLFPGFTDGVVGELQHAPKSAVGYGLLAVLVLIPLTIVLAGLAWLFWGVFPGAMAATFFLIGLWGLLWILSPAIAGYWLGQMLLRESNSKLLQLFAGGALILLAARAARWIPIVGGSIGWLVMLCSFVLAVGGLIAFYRQRRAGAISEQLPTPPAIGMHPTAA